MRPEESAHEARGVQSTFMLGLLVGVDHRFLHAKKRPRKVGIPVLSHVARWGLCFTCRANQKLDSTSG